MPQPASRMRAAAAAATCLSSRARADRAHARVPPLALLGLVHARVLFDVHRACRRRREDDAVDEGAARRARPRARSRSARARRRGARHRARRCSPAASGLRPRTATPLTATVSVPAPAATQPDVACPRLAERERPASAVPSTARHTAPPQGWRTLQPSPQERRVGGQVADVDRAAERAAAEVAAGQQVVARGAHAVARGKDPVRGPGGGRARPRPRPSPRRSAPRAGSATVSSRGIRPSRYWAMSSSVPGHERGDARGDGHERAVGARASRMAVEGAAPGRGRAAGATGANARAAIGPRSAATRGRSTSGHERAPAPSARVGPVAIARGSPATPSHSTGDQKSRPRRDENSAVERRRARPGAARGQDGPPRPRARGDPQARGVRARAACRTLRRGATRRAPAPRSTANDGGAHRPGRPTARERRRPRSPKTSATSVRQRDGRAPCRAREQRGQSSAAPATTSERAHAVASARRAASRPRPNEPLIVRSCGWSWQESVRKRLATGVWMAGRRGPVVGEADGLGEAVAEHGGELDPPAVEARG